MSVQEINDDEIDLGELFSALLIGWITVFAFTMIFFLGSVYYALNGPEEKFESVAKIQFDEEVLLNPENYNGIIAIKLGYGSVKNLSEKYELTIPDYIVLQSLFFLCVFYSGLSLSLMYVIAFTFTKKRFF